MKKERVNIPVSRLELNDGQIEWLPKNPREWTKSDVELMERSLEEDPDFMEDRPPLVVEIPGKEGCYCVFGGNFRVYTEKRRKKVKELVCVLYTVESVDDRETVIRRAMKDNGHFGDWDFDTLANEWDGYPLDEWGVPSYDPEKVIEKAKKDEEVMARMPFIEVLNEKHNYVVLYFDNEVDWLQVESILELQQGKRPATSESGNSDKFQSAWLGVGRVVRGPEAIEKIMEAGKKL